MQITIQRIYEDSQKSGYRALVDRLWPRGISKAKADLAGWWKDLAPSPDLRKWFDHDEDKWGEFRKKYLHELSQSKEMAREHLADVSEETLILLYGAKSECNNHARVLKEYLEKLL
ncbi:MAG: DUF488 family protein [Alphaproteobacteria bacterium]|nr:DUF488 family protein [Alphaproteobacteria bacterium]